MAGCIVSFVDLDGVRHSVEVEAEGLYEASVVGLCAFRKHDLEPGGLTQLEVEVRSSVTHTLPVTKVREWLQRGVRSLKEAVLKERLRTLLSARSLGVCCRLSRSGCCLFAYDLVWTLVLAQALKRFLRFRIRKHV